jgi:hypothetical protein
MEEDAYPGEHSRPEAQRHPAELDRPLAPSADDLL